MKNMKLSVKLIGGFLIVGMIVLIVGFVGWNGISKTLNAVEEMSYMQNIAKEMLQKEIDHLNWARKVGEFQGNENITELNVEKDEHNCAFGKWYYSGNRKKAESVMPEIADLLKQVEEPHTKLHNSAKELEKMLNKGKEFRNEAVTYYATETNSSLKEVQRILEQIIPKVINHVEEQQKETRTGASQTKSVALIGIVFGTFFAMALGIFLTISITRPLNRVIAGLTDGADQVSSAAGQVSSSSQSLAEGTSEQASSLEETSSSLEEMSSMTKQNADHANQAKAMMSEAGTIVEKVDRHMKEMAGAVGEITQSSEETGKIIKTIDEIAFQTNLLALNAAVEAARAGEAGAGFAVVADEVRNLAMRASEAAKNTSNLIENTIKAVRKGNELTNATQEAFKENADIARKIGQLVDEIATASEEQSHGIAQVNIAVTEMDKVTQSTAANAEESAAASEELSAQAEQMKVFVEDLVRVVGGSATGSRGNGHGLPKSRITASKAPVLQKKIAGRQLAIAGKPPRKSPRPEEVIPMNDGEFKDF